MPIEDILGLAGRVALVTGAASGYGKSTSELLAKVGAHVVACDINESGLDTLIANLERAADHLPLRADISDVSQCEQLVTTTLRRYQRLDVLVNAAAVLQPANIEEVDEQLWNRTLDVNLKSQYFLSRAACRPMKEARWGRIINFISTAGITGGTLPASVYGISKAGVIAMTKSFARAFGRDNILVNAISPATLRTPLFRRRMSDAELAAVSDSYLGSCLFGRWTRPEEVAMSVIYLASEMSSCVSGHVLRADSGAGVLHP
jgi:3-oxoacyl-[acyl-carrier protein] reductase